MCNVILFLKTFPLIYYYKHVFFAYKTIFEALKISTAVYLILKVLTSTECNI